MKRLYILVIVIFLFISSTALSGQSDKFQSIEVNGIETDLSIFSIFVAPKALVTIKAKSKAKSLIFTFEDKKLGRKFIRNWSFNAPEQPGLYKLTGKNIANGSRATINIFVTVPYNKMVSGRIEGYQIGQYPTPKKKKSVSYITPQGFIRVDKKDKDTFLTPHFRLNQFLCKQSSGYPKYLILKENLVLLLEDLLSEVRSKGYNIDTFGFISGYRTPFYNKTIKNVAYSRHIYGDAADIFIDFNKDERMDDLNGDGKVNLSDARILYNIADNLNKSQMAHKFKGGIGLYKSTAYHDGFIHVDTRGYPARWE